MMRDPVPMAPECPVCENRGRRSDLPQLGRWVCEACTPLTFYDGSISEWERLADARKRKALYAEDS